MRFFKIIYGNCGQSLLEGLIISLLITIFMFGAIQVCIMCVDDMFVNFVAFRATRKISVTKRKQINNTAKQSVSKILSIYSLNSNSIRDYKTTHWDEEVLGNKIKDHHNSSINKHNVKIGYDVKIMFGRLFNASSYRHQSARARMIKSPDEEYYNRAYPDAKEFPLFK
ncbi:MAG: hypothetical protein AB7E39_02450 [Endomicrobiaceae bacterium]